MNMTFRSAALAVALFGLAACNKGADEAASKVAEPVAISLPADSSDESWKPYLQAVVKQNLHGVRSSPFMYYLPAATTEGFEDLYGRQLDNVAGVIARTVTPGNMLAFGSPESTRMADLVIEAFKEADAGSFKNVKVLFIGKAEDEARVREALAASAADFIFVEAK